MTGWGFRCEFAAGTPPPREASGVAGTLAELLHEPRIGRQILELDKGSTPIKEAVRANIRER